jgi:hypothetical protein
MNMKRTWQGYGAKLCLSLMLMSQPHFEANVRMKLTFPKVGTWSLLRLLKIQSLNVGVKTPHIEVFFIPLEMSWNVDVQNGLAWAIWTYAPQVMLGKKGLKVGNRLDPSVCKWSATHHWKALEESYKFSLDLIPIGGLS